MNHPPSQILEKFLQNKTLVVTASTGTNENWPCFIGVTPDRDGVPSNVVTIFDTEGDYDGRYTRTGVVVEHPGYQIVVRAADYVTGYQKIRTIRDKITQEATKAQITLDSSTYVIQAAFAGTIIPMGTEKGNTKNRHLFSINGTISFKT
jgi:hypothetical protein